MKIDIATNSREIAIVGMACRFPGAPDYETFWNNLSKGISSIREIDRWNFNEHSSSNRKDSKSIGKCCGLLDDIDKFDNNFFHISPREAIHMDPQQRILLEEAWHCIEDSGISLRELQQKRTSIYVGTVAMDLYQGLPDEKEIDIYSGTGMYRFMLANRLSYFLGLSGESIVLEAACASASVAICNAKKALQTGDCDYALVAGANLHMSPLRHQIYVKNRMLSKDGKSKTFDKDADGFVAGEGIGFLLLQSLDKAVQQQNHIFGVIKGCAVNHGGKAVSVSAPRVEAQRDVILAAYEDAEISAETVNYIEAHGTGTSLGDPIEVEALTQAFQKFTSEKQFCKIGSVKTNIGHLEATAGMAGVIKVLLMMRHKKIPPTLNIKTVNPIIDFKNSPFSIANELTEWKNRDGLPLRAGASSFGLGGVNSHILLEEYLDKNTVADSSNVTKYPFALSAKNEKSLEGMLDKWRSFVKSDAYAQYSIRDICLTLLTGRENLAFRYGSLISNKAELVELLDKTTPAFLNKVDESWGLCVGDFVWNSYAELEPIIKEFPIFKENLEKALDSIEEYDKGRKIKKGFLATTWPKSKINLYSFIANYTCISTLVDLGLSLSLITGVKSGLWVSLVVSGATSLGEVIKVLCGKKAVAQIEVARPLIPFYDPINKVVIKPYVFGEEYIHDLISEVDIPDEVITHYWKKAQLLSENQFTFIHFLDEWDSKLKTVGLDIKTLFADKENLILKDEKNRRKKLLFMIVIMNCLYRLNQKWNLSERKLITDERFHELLDLVLDDVMPKDTLIALLISDKPELTIVTDTLKARQNKINICKAYKYLKQRSRKVTDIVNIGQWVEQILIQEDLVSLPDMEYLDFGKIANRNSEKKTIIFNQQEDILVAMHEVLNSLWIRGVNVQWNRMYTENSFQKIPLPVYVFDRTSFWLPDNRAKQATYFNEVVEKNATVDNFLHPLVHKNTSSFFEERFSSEFTGQEFFLKDHVIEDQKILPGVAYLEMAREAVEQALGGVEEEKTKICLKNIVWIRPMSVNDQPVQVNIGLVTEDSGEITYEIYSQSKDNDVLYSRGIAVLEPCSEISNLNLKQLQEDCSQKKLLSDQCYEMFKTMGFSYGPGHQGIKEIHVGTNQLLARLSLPEVVADTEKQYVLHPSVMDAALQASICLTVDDDTNRGEAGKIKPLLPFALQDLKIFDNCTACMWASVRYSAGSKAGDTVQKFDIDLCDDNGKVCIQMRGFSTRTPQGELGASSTRNHGVLMVHPYWQEQAVRSEYIAPNYVQHLVILCEVDRISAESIKNQMQDAMCITLETKKDDIAERFSTYAIQVFEEIKSIIKEKPKGDVLVQIVILPEKERQLFSGLAGLLKTAQLENQKLKAQIIEIEKNDDSLIMIKKLKENSCCPQDTQIRYQGDKRLVAGWNNIESSSDEVNVLWKDEGIYLITGGTGGLGLIFARDIAEKVKGATLILTGRSKLNQNKQMELKKIEEKGIKIDYKQVDVTQKQDVGSLIKTIGEQYGRLDGIIHAAGIIRDNYIINKATAEFQEVLAPKVTGLMNLDQESKNFDLDFFVVFSSIAGSLGNLGQADYSTANAFMDAYAKYRSELVALKLRKGKTLSINWPLWKDGGMHVNAQTEKMMMENQGMAVMQTANGIKALYQGMELENTQMMVLEGSIDRMRRNLLKQADCTINQINKSAATIDNSTLLEKVQATLIQAVSKLLGIAIENIDVDAELSEYGFDSITFTEFSNQLNQEYKLELTPTIFFEYPTLCGFASYLVEEHQDALASHFVVQADGIINQINKSAVTIDNGTLLEKVQVALIQDVSKLLGVASENIDIEAELSEYGFDSITFTEFSNQLNQEYKLELTPTIFFEYPTLCSFANYLVEQHQDVLAPHFAVQAKVEAPIQPIEYKKEEISSNKRQHSRFVRTMAVPAEKSITNNSEPIAIVGMSGIFPMSKDVNELWTNLVEGKDCISEIPETRWDWREYYGDPKKEANKSNVKWGGFIDGVDEFDPLFFGISPREAELMDPQQRLLMIHAWKVIEDAGYSAQSLSGSQTGMFVGTMSTGYNQLIAEANVAVEGYSSTGMVPSVGPNRMSYFLNIHGPSEPVETACSSALVAIHRAVSAIENGSCEMALVGGVNTMVTPDFQISFNKAGMLCEDGRCKTFSNKANGYVRGEGAGMIFLKKLKDAEQAGDHIYGVIRGSAENHGGRANSLTAPNPKAQAEVLKAAYTKAGIDPRSVTYIEAHGTGTELGDPIEINGLKTAFKDLYQATGGAQVVNSHCGVGSVKTNIGHLEIAAGIAGVIKVLLQLKHKTLVKTLHCDTINPYIQLKDSPFYIVQETKEWKAIQDERGNDLPRRAGVSSFGFGGANAHVVIEEYIPKAKKQQQNLNSGGNPAIIVLSAKNEEQLKERAQQLLNAIKKQQFSDADLLNMAYTLQIGRDVMEERLAMLVGSIKELEEKLTYFIEGKEKIQDIYHGNVKRNKEAISALVTDEDMSKIMDIWMTKGKLGKLLDMWVKGVDVKWNNLYGSVRPQRMSLPTYPFAKEHYWIAGNKKLLSTISLNVRKETDFNYSFYEHLLDDLIDKTIDVSTASQKVVDFNKRVNI